MSPVTDEPVRGSFAYLESPWLLGLSGLEQFQTFADGKVPPPPIFHLSGLDLTDIGLGMVTASMPASPWWRSGVGIFLGGTLAFVADMALSGAIFSSLPPATALLTSELSMSFLRPASVESGTINARGRLIQAGRSQGLSEAQIQDARGRLLAFATSRSILSRLGIDLTPPPNPIPHVEPPQHETPDPYLRPAPDTVNPTEKWEVTGGLDLIRRWLDPDHDPPPVGHLTGWRATEVDEGRVTWVMPASRWFCNPAGSFYGGAVAMLADVAMNAALTTTLPAGTAYGTLDIKVNFLRPPIADERDITARARVVRRGRTVAVTTADLEDADGRGIAMAVSSSMILDDRPWEEGKPVAPIDDAPPREE